MAWKINNCPVGERVTLRILALTCKNVAGAGDENRTRTISLGMSVGARLTSTAADRVLLASP